MTTAIRCELHSDDDSMRPLAVVRVSLRPLWKLPGANGVVEYDLCRRCYEGAKAAGDMLVGATVEELR